MDDYWRAAFEQLGTLPEDIEKLYALAIRAEEVMKIDQDAFFAAVYAAVKKPTVAGDTTTYRLAVLGNHRFLVPVKGGDT